MGRWHHRLNGHAYEQTLGVGDRQGSLVCHSPWGRKASDTTERLNQTDPLNLQSVQNICEVSVLQMRQLSDRACCLRSHV